MALKNEPVDRLYETGEDDTTQEKDHIFVWKDIWRQVEMYRDSPKVIDASIQPHSQSSDSDIGSYCCFEYIVAQQGQCWPHDSFV
jgi:hypothetical protein